MTAKPKPRIPRKIKEFDDYISATDDRQLAINPDTTEPYYKLYGWTDAESEAWTAFRTASNGLYGKYKNKKTDRTTQVTEDAGLNITACIKYDNHPVEGHFLLDNVAKNGSTTDWLLFNVKRGTALQDTVGTPSADIGTKEPQINITDIGHLFHKLTFTNPDAPGSKAKPDGIKDIQIYYALTPADAPEPALSAYQYHGDFTRGHAIINFTAAEVKKVAWYIARYESTKGEKGSFCIAVSATII